MARIVMAGGGIAALTTAMLLGEDGHEVTVLERDPAVPPSPSAAWDEWKRRYVAQFRLPHLFVSRFRAEVDRELPGLAAALDGAGALRFNPLALAPPAAIGGFRDGDRAYEMLTGRRAVMEAVIAAAAQAAPCVRVRRGVEVAGLLTGDPAPGGVPRVTGARTTGGEQLAADLVVDATGRRSPLGRWLADCGAAPPAEELEDSGFVYYGRHFRSADGSVPPMLGPGLQEYGTVSSLTLPADHGTWSVVIVASAADPALGGLGQAGTWTAVVKALPLVAHWVDAEPVEDHIVTIAKIEDRHRSLVVGGQPVATGVAGLADAWGCTNPSLGRGISIGVLHGRVLRDTLRRSDPADAARFAADFHAATMSTVEPWYRSTVRFDRHRLGEIGAQIRGEAYEPGDPWWDDVRGLQLAAGQDPDCLRASLDVINVLRTPDEVLADPVIAGRARAAFAARAGAPAFGPSRAELVAMAHS
ncbi:MAG TPA: FAD-dependent oxidoreductase [Streptosporangiaceae bacterium]|jgi:2-polyprenyl-6-methoxyphenol hydroxylase-like FAD-dependent oxidoreductase